MRRPEDYSRRAARPSLLTPAQQAEAARNRILTNLQDGGAAQRRPALRRVLLWGGGGALLVAAGVLYFTFGSPTMTIVPGLDGAVVATRSAGPASDPVVPVVPVAPAPAAATIEDGQPAELQAGTPAALPHNIPPVSAPVAAAVPTPLPGTAVVTAHNSTGAVRPAPQRSGSKLAVRKIDQKIARSQTTGATADLQRQADAERDVTLLQAMVAHEQGEPAAAPGLDAQLASCRRLASAEAARCRQRVCRGHVDNDGDCTAPAR